MSIYEATVIKTGNSYALRVPKKYTTDNNLETGQKVFLFPPMHTQQAKRETFDAVLQELKQYEPYSEIEDPLEWQRSIRRDRPLTGTN